MPDPLALRRGFAPVSAQRGEQHCGQPELGHQHQNARAVVSREVVQVAEHQRPARGADGVYRHHKPVDLAVAQPAEEPEGEVGAQLQLRAQRGARQDGAEDHQPPIEGKADEGRPQDGAYEPDGAHHRGIDPIQRHSRKEPAHKLSDRETRQRDRRDPGVHAPIGEKGSEVSDKSV